MQRNFGIDLLRTLSIWLVLLDHTGFNRIAKPPLVIGGIGVEIFFVVSGFLIGGIIINDIDKGFSLLQTLKHFWVRRWFRIIPLYYAVLCFKYFLIDDSIGSNILYYFFFLQTNFYNFTYYAVTWTLVVEEWFYLLSPFFIFFVLRYKKPFVLSVALLVTFIFLTRYLLIIYGQGNYVKMSNNPFLRMDSLFTGVVIAYGYHNKWKIFSLSFARPLFIIAAISCTSYLFFLWSKAYPIYLLDEIHLFGVAGFFIFPFLISLMIPFAITISISQKNIFANTAHRFVTKTGTLSYSIYLTHMFIVNLKINAVLSFALIYLLAELINRFFEKPILKLRDKIQKPYPLMR